MNDKIKEILKEIECYRNEELCLILLSREESNALLDHITNLQQENERLKETLEEHDETLEKTFNLVAQLSLRIDKAIEYIKENNCPDPYCLTNDLLNILQNERNKK